MIRLIRSGFVVFVLSGCLGVASCGEAAETPGIPGTYALDKEASKTALPKAVAALDNDDVAELVEAIARDEMDQQFTIEADGTWTGMTQLGGRTLEFSGTWTLSGDDLEIAQLDPPAPSQTHWYRDGVIEIRNKQGLAVAVLRRK